uniref:Uncharacterized protein n=1 Tax=Rhizophora mucronata TaxID=61149 RepID=A0A2P2NMG0_RHIMU
MMLLSYLICRHNDIGVILCLSTVTHTLHNLIYVVFVSQFLCWKLFT